MGCSQSHLDPHGVAEESRKKAGLGPWSGDDVKAGRKADDGEERPGSPSFRFYFEGPWIDKDSAKVADAGEDHGKTDDKKERILHPSDKTIKTLATSKVRNPRANHQRTKDGNRKF
ncbi:unnamed protein product [Musa hybrid cultivar]